MINDKSQKEKNTSNEEPLKAECPFCGSFSSIILDPKHAADKKSLHLCLVCGQTFEYINR